MSLKRLQHRLQDIYELSIDENVDDFLITDPALAAELCEATMPGDCGERLLLREDTDGLNVSLYVNAAVIDGLAAGQGAHAAIIEDLHAFCLALEGVSHFLYLVWHASHDRSVSLLEMELQAEVDKYVVIREVLGGVKRALPAPGLIHRLFRSAGYHAALGVEEQRRYRAANRCAERYCRRLESEYYGARSRGELLKELRRFYRLPGRDKVLAAAASY